MEEHVLAVAVSGAPQGMAVSAELWRKGVCGHDLQVVVLGAAMLGVALSCWSGLAPGPWVGPCSSWEE